MQKILKGFILLPLRFYRYVLSPQMGACCRFYPSCSVYMMEAVQRHGAGAGLFLGIRRVLRCHPWYKGAFMDPVPERFDWRVPFRYKRGNSKL